MILLIPAYLFSFTVPSYNRPSANGQTVLRKNADDVAQNLPHLCARKCPAQPNHKHRQAICHLSLLHPPFPSSAKAKNLFSKTKTGHLTNNNIPCYKKRSVTHTPMSKNIYICRAYLREKS